jgi:hypothetical protein
LAPNRFRSNRLDNTAHPLLHVKMIWSEADWEKDGFVNGRKTTINLCSLERPHMRAFWYTPL